MKKIFALFLVFTLLLGITAFSQENEICVVHDLGDFKIVAEKYRVTVPHEYYGPVYMYRNYGVTDKDGNSVVPPIYQGILPHSEGRAAFAIDGKIGFFDENWNVCIDAKYYCNQLPFSDFFFSEGLAAVPKKDEKRYMVWGYIDREGNEVIDFVYDSAKPFEDGVAVVALDENTNAYNVVKTKYGKIDKEGNIVEPFKFGYALGKDYEYFWREPIEVQLSQNLVELNGVRYKNSDIEYPFINYLGYSYFPLTYYGCRMLGINCDWTKESGVVLTSGGTAEKDIVGENGMSDGVCETANFYRGKLTINGKVYEHGDTVYPLIHFRNIVYVPVLWQTGMEQLGIEYDFIGAEKIENSDRGCMVFKTE